MITIIFWNIGKNRAVSPHLECLVRNHEVDLFILAEVMRRVDLVALSSRLTKLGKGSFREVDNVRGKTIAITRLDSKRLKHKFTGTNGYLSAWSLSSPKFPYKGVIIAGVHLRSKFGGLTTADQSDYAKPIVNELRSLEDQVRHSNTILLGDFNMNPYDHGMTSWAAMHGLMTTALASKTGHEHQSRRFYNPMWGLFGDRSPGAAGSFYWKNSAPHNPHWVIFDQVLLRPSIIPTLVSLEILANDGNHALTKKDGTPDRSYLSDHLPVLARFDL